MNHLQYYLTKLAEEGAEVAQIALKTQQFGHTEVTPGQPLSNFERCQLELDDLWAMVEELNDKFGFGYTPNRNRMEAKKEKVQKYLNFSIHLGMVDGPPLPLDADRVRRVPAALIDALRSDTVVMEHLPELPGYNGSILTIDDEEAARIAANIGAVVLVLESATKGQCDCKGKAATQCVPTYIEHVRQSMRDMPAGWVLVPIEPTEAMRDAAHRLPDVLDVGDEYRAMLAAVPQPPAQPEPDNLPFGMTDDQFMSFVDEEGFVIQPDAAFALRDALARKVAPVHPGAQWQPIETAPKDGSEILVMYTHIDTQIVHNGMWIEDGDPPGWWTYDKSEVGRMLLDDWMTPTHWMPLPAAPSQGENP